MTKFIATAICAQRLCNCDICIVYNAQLHPIDNSRVSTILLITLAVSYPHMGYSHI